MTQTISMQPDERLELGFGHVHQGEEAWMYQEYFPAIRPVFADYGLRTLASFAVTASNVPDIAPLQGSLGSWPSAKHRVDFHVDPRFAAVQQRRDAALTMSDGHLFEAISAAAEVSSDEDYAIVVTVRPAPEGALFETPLASDSKSLLHEGKSLSVHRWSEACDRLLAGTPDDALVLRVRFNPSQGA